jgi:hypothetical protein
MWAQSTGHPRIAQPAGPHNCAHPADPRPFMAHGIDEGRRRGPAAFGHAALEAHCDQNQRWPAWITRAELASIKSAKMPRMAWALKMVFMVTSPTGSLRRR